MMQNNKQFTLIELLVLLAIIGILASILLPSLGRAREEAKRSVCQSNLAQWGRGILLHHNDNNRKIMKQIDRYGRQNSLKIHTTLDGSNVFTDAENEWSVYAINPYIGNAFDLKNGAKQPAAAMCPSTDTDLWSTHMKLQTGGLGVTYMQYMYFGRSDLVKDHSQHNGNDAKEVLTGKFLDSEGIIMADSLHYDNSANKKGVTGGWSYNHGKVGDSYSEHYGWDRFGALPNQARFGYDYGPQPKYWDGGARLYGDGHVVWNRNDTPDEVPGVPGINSVPYLGPGDQYFW